MDLEICLKRISAWIESFESTKHFAEQRVRTLSGIVGKAMVDARMFSPNELKSVSTVVDAQIEMNKTLISMLNEFRKNVSTLITSYDQQLHNASKNMTNSTKSLLKATKASRKDADTAWKKYEHAIIYPKEGSDMAVLSHAFVVSLHHLRLVQHQIRLDLQTLMNQIQKTDRLRIDRAREFVFQYFEYEKRAFHGCIKCIDEFLVKVNAMNGQIDSETFMKSLEVFQADGVAAELPIDTEKDKKLTRLVYQSITFQSKLWRPGRIITSNMKECFGIISHAGFLYIFDTDQSAHVTFSIDLKICELQHGTEDNPLVFTLISHAKRSVFAMTSSPLKYTFKAFSGDQLLQWISALRHHCLV